MNPTCIDCFSGSGGLSLGLSNAGFNIIYSFDKDELAISTQKLNNRFFKHTCETKGIEEILKDKNFLKKLGIKRGELNLLAGGPPCQGFSVQRVGEDEDERNDLVLKYGDLIEKTFPEIFLLENVPGILGRRGMPIIKEFLNKTSEMGYSIYKKILNAEEFGVPQRRKRVFIIGIRNDVHNKEFTFPEKTNRGTKVTVRDTISSLPKPPTDGTDHPRITHHRSDKLSPKNLQRIMALKEGQGREHLPKKLLAKCHQVSSAKIGHRNVYGRMDWDEVAPTITARFDSFTRGKFGHPEQNRSITLREGALLQTFPMDFVFTGNKVDIARQIGNAVPPKLAEVVGRHLIDYINQ